MPLSLIIMWEGQECKEGFLRLSLEIYNLRFDDPNTLKIFAICGSIPQTLQREKITSVQIHSDYTLNYPL